MFKYFELNLVFFWDEWVNEFGVIELSWFSEVIWDINYWIFVDLGEVYLMGGGVYFYDCDLFVIFD